MRNSLLTLALLFGTIGSLRADEMPRLAKERIVLHTVAGDIVLALYPEVAPAHVKQILTLTRLGLYDTTDFPRVHPGFVAQVSNHYARKIPPTEEQKAAIQYLPLEASPQLHHRRGILSMAREDNKPDSAQTSFSILLGDAPHLDGQYTIFGHVERGMEVTDEFLRALPPVAPGATPKTQPVVRLEIVKAEVVESSEALSGMVLRPAQPIPISAADWAQATRIQGITGSDGGSIADPRESELLTIIWILVDVLALIMIVGLAHYYLAHRLAPARLLSLNLVTVLIAGFILFAVLNVRAQDDAHDSESSHWFGVLLFLGTLGLLRLMGRFESPDASGK